MTTKTWQILLPVPLDKAWSYEGPADLAVGSYVRVQFGKRELPGVVWGEGEPRKDSKKIIHVFDAPPMRETQRKFITWMANYICTPRGLVLKMCLSVPDALDPPVPVMGYAFDHIPENFRQTAAREKTIQYIKEHGPATRPDIANAIGVSTSVINGLATAGILKQVEIKQQTPPLQNNKTDLVLTKDQKNAAEILVQKIGAGASVTLLDGVTGSGKTETYYEAVAETLKQKKQALILLPEIALSAQAVSRFEKRFGTACLWHSDTTATHRRTTWRDVADGTAQVVIGARSALFLPFADLGLIIIDEEHDGSYKQEEGVTYNARDMGVALGHMLKIPVILSSATPSLETLANVQKQKYDLVSLPNRVKDAVLPDIELIDMRAQKMPATRFIAPPLQKAIEDVLQKNQQALLYLNRRGYAPLTLCRTCGYRLKCPNCTSWLVDHRRTHILQCHHCGFQVKSVRECPSCHNEDTLHPCGPGVERLHEEIKKYFPTARVAVMASDTMTTHKMIQRTILNITDHKIDIIIGTQIVAKGHHFPDLTLVGVIDADLGLSGGDLRAAEKTFQLLNQVSGRAGREGEKGHVFIQTYMPDHPVMQALKENDRNEFMEVEAQERAAAHMPPFGRLAAIIVSSPDPGDADHAAHQLRRHFPALDNVTILGPAPAPLAIIRGKHRRRLLIKAGKSTDLQAIIRQWLDATNIPPKVKIQIDIDPQSFL